MRKAQASKPAGREERRGGKGKKGLFLSFFLSFLGGLAGKKRKEKGSKAKQSKQKHPTQPPLPVALALPGRQFSFSWQRKEVSVRRGRESSQEWSGVLCVQWIWKKKERKTTSSSSSTALEGRAVSEWQVAACMAVVGKQ